MIGLILGLAVVGLLLYLIEKYIPMDPMIRTIIRVVVVVLVVVLVLLGRLRRSGVGRAIIGVRENEQAARALGKDATRARLFAFLVGGGLGGLSGAVLVAFITAWNPASWGYGETFVYITAIVVGGFGNDIGILLGVLLLDSVAAALVIAIPGALALWLSTLRYLIRGIGAANRGERPAAPAWICARIVRA